MLQRNKQKRLKTKEKNKKAIETRVEMKLLDTDQISIASLFSIDFFNEQAIYKLNKS